MSGISPSSLVDGAAGERVAEAVLRAAGGRTVLLRMPAAASASDAEQLGLLIPRFQDAPLGPAAFRTAVHTKTLLISARAVRTTLHATGAASAQAMFSAAAGLLIDGDLYRIEKAVAMGSAGQPYCWAVTLNAPMK